MFTAVTLTRYFSSRPTLQECTCRFWACSPSFPILPFPRPRGFGRSAATSYLDQAVRGQSMPEKANAKTDWRRAVSANRWLSLACETPLPDPASEKYKRIANPALPLRQTLDVCPCDIRAFWAAKLSFRAERHREREGETGWRRELDSNSQLSFLNTLSKGARTRSRALWRLKTQVRA